MAITSLAVKKLLLMKLAISYASVFSLQLTITTIIYWYVSHPLNGHLCGYSKMTSLALVTS